MSISPTHNLRGYSSEQLTEAIQKVEATKKRVKDAVFYLFLLIALSGAVGFGFFHEVKTVSVPSYKKIAGGIGLSICITSICTLVLVWLGLSLKNYRASSAQLASMRGDPRQPLIPMQNV